MLRAVLSIDGDHACALLGEDLMVGEAEFVKIVYRDDWARFACEIGAARTAFRRLQERLKESHPHFSYVLGSGLAV